MIIQGIHAVITGGASGIGAAIGERLLADGAAAVVLADVNESLLVRTAGRLGERYGNAVHTIVADVSTAAGNEALVLAAKDAVGTIDLFCANAGIASGVGPEGPDEVWDRVLRINTMSHVWAARALLPDWLAQGSGYFLATASAAGLLTNLGDAPYSVSKAGAVAFADWMSATYGDRGIKVSCLCPQGVRTPLLFGPEDGDGLPTDGVSGSPLAAEVVKAQRIIEPSDVAQCVVDAIADERFLILPHEEVAKYMVHKATDRDRWLRSMRKLQAFLTPGA